MAKPKRFTVLVATDGSEPALAAVNAMTTFPWPPGTQVHAVVVRTGVLADLPEPVLTEIDRNHAAVAEQARTILARRWPDAKASVVDAPVVPAILARAQRVSARTIVLGSRGHGAIARLLIGSVSLDVVRAMKRSALVVRGNVKSFARVVLGMDGSAPSRRAVQFLANLDVPAGGRITIVSVLEQVALPSLAMMPASARGLIQGQADKENAALEKRARGVAETAAKELREAGWAVDVAIRNGAPLDEILDATKSTRAQLLALGARGKKGVERLLLGSVAEGSLHRAEVSVLIVR